MRSWTCAVVLAAWTCSISPVKAQDSLKPDHAVVLGFDRLFAKDPSALGGRLLLGELNCTSCHKAAPLPPPLTKGGPGGVLLKKQAPILDGVGGRVRPSYFRAFLDNPQAAKPGTTMPNLLAALPEQERKQSLEALVHFLASTGTFIDVQPSPKSIAKGKNLFHQVGCAACHGPETGTRTVKLDATVLPLGDLDKKYSIISLTNFLHDPHKTRPSGRMPSLNLNSSEATDIAHYLLAKLSVAGSGGNVNYAYYELDQDPDQLPDFAKLKPSASGVANGFDLGFAQRLNNVAMKFEGMLRVPNAGKYTLSLTSDDGSKLWIGKRLIVNNDGIHAPTTRTASVTLSKGQQPITVGVFNAGGGYELAVDIEGPGVSRQPLANFVTLGKEAPAPNFYKHPVDHFIYDETLVKKGRVLFASLGCASCHNLKEGNANIVSTLVAPELAKLNAGAGCLAETVKADAPRSPRYSLNKPQRAALIAALRSDPPQPPLRMGGSQTIVQTMATFNCYACHKRDGIGGVEFGLNDFFTTTQKEMGDEGRLPPHLNGVGGKLTAAYLKNVLANGGKDRPYMLTRMPKFGAGNVGNLQAALEAADPVPSAPMPAFTVADKKIKSAGRYMVGNSAFGCIKCHNFREYVSGGVRGINMTIMADRVRREWFTQYLLDPNKYRPGTRMPAVWPFGQSQLPKVLDGDTAQQIEAVWRYLADGTKAALPFGVGREQLPLIPQDKAITYRNFIQGAGPRAIGVGYPEKINLAFDANDLRYALLWHKEFIDASRHWNGRGEGFEPPLGEGVLQLATGPSIAILEGKDGAWPTKAQRDKGYQFRGYTFDDKLRPTFAYSLGGVHVDDFMLPTAGKDGEHFQRTITITTDSVPADLWFRAATGPQIKDVGNGWFAVGNDLKVRLETRDAPIVRASGGTMELLVPILNKETRIVQDLVW